MFKKILALTILLGVGHFASAQTSSSPVLTDAQIGKVLVTINEGEIDAAKMAQHKAQQGEVKDFAKMMADEHKTNKEETKKIVKKIKGDRDSDLAKSLAKDAKSANKDLKKTDKMAFDKAYVDQQVMMHQKALATLKETLIPQAKDAALKSHLMKTEVAVTQHLEHAQKMQK